MFFKHWLNKVLSIIKRPLADSEIKLAESLFYDKSYTPNGAGEYLS